MLKSLILIFVTLFVFVGCGEDCPVDVDERIIEKPTPCENKMLLNEFVDFNYTANYKGISTNDLDYGRHLENSKIMQEILKTTQYNNLNGIEFNFVKNNNAIIVNANQDEILSTDLLGGHLITQNDKYSPIIYRYRFIKYVIIEDVQFKLIYSLTYYFSPDLENNLKLRVYDYYFSFMATDVEWRDNNQRVTNVVNKYFSVNQSNTVTFRYNYFKCY